MKSLNVVCNSFYAVQVQSECKNPFESNTDEKTYTIQEYNVALEQVHTIAISGMGILLKHINNMSKSFKFSPSLWSEHEDLTHLS